MCSWSVSICAFFCSSKITIALKIPFFVLFMCALRLRPAFAYEKQNVYERNRCWERKGGKYRGIERISLSNVWMRIDVVNCNERKKSGMEVRCNKKLAREANRDRKRAKAEEIERATTRWRRRERNNCELFHFVPHYAYWILSAYLLLSKFTYLCVHEREIKIERELANSERIRRFDSLIHISRISHGWALDSHFLL